jgi:hypothetical protein
MIAGDHAPNFPLKHAQKVNTLHICFLSCLDLSSASAPCLNLLARNSVALRGTFTRTLNFRMAVLHTSHVKYYTPCCMITAALTL